MKVRDPKKIIMPGQNVTVDAAVQEMQAKQAMESNPLVKMINTLRQQLAQVMAQNQILLVRIQSLTDYMAQAGLLLHQDVTDQGTPVGAPYTPTECNTKIFEPLVDEHVIEMPEYGYTAFFVEYSIRTRFVTNLLAQLEKGALKFKDVIESIRYFNNEPGRLAPIQGNEFGLPQYLNMNPDRLSDDELVVLAEEFGLQKQEEVGDGVVEEPPQAETNVVPIKPIVEG